jgi:hypothetical protein
MRAVQKNKSFTLRASDHTAGELHARAALGTAVETAPDEFMFMPAGVQESVFGDVDGNPVKCAVLIDRTTAGVMQAALQRLSAAKSPNKPYFDFNHEETKASAWPEEFFWRDGAAPGVYVRAGWSASGKSAVTGKDYRSFSPAFCVDRTDGTPANPARIIGAPFIMGGLVNDPAFKTISPLWAKSAAKPTAAADDHANDQETMKTLQQLQAKLANLETEVNVLRAANKAEDAHVLTAKLAQQKQLEAEIATEIAVDENNTLKAKLTAQREQKADACIAAAIARRVPGFVASPAADSAEFKLQAKWKGLIVADETNAELLATMKGEAAETTLTAGSQQPADAKIITDLNGAIKAYGTEVDSMKRGILYAKAIRDTLAKSDGFAHVLRAANSLGTVAPGILAQRSLDLLLIQFPILGRISTNFSAEGAAYNEAVTTRLITVPSVGTYSTSLGYVSQDATTTDVAVTMNAHKFVQVTFNANEIAGTRRQLFGEQDQAMHYAIAKDLVDAIYALATTANYTETPTDVAKIDFSRASVVDIGTAMQTGSANRNANSGVRTLLLASDYYGQLAKDTTVVGNLVNANANGAIASGIIPDVHGFMVVDAPNLPATGNLKGLALRADAVALAVRPASDYSTAIAGLPSSGLVQTITNADTGLSVSMVAFVDHQLGATSMRLAWMRGQSVGNLKAGQLVRSGA